MNTQKKMLLLVDDSEIDLEILSAVLEDHFDTLEAISASEALDYLQDPYINVDAMLLDISMPEMDGFSMLDLMEQENLPIPPLFMISSEATQNNVTKALVHHAKGFIRKPFQKDDVIRQISKGLGISVENLTTQQTQPAVQPTEAPAEKPVSKPQPSIFNDPFSYEESMEYITRLRALYSQFLIQMDYDIDHYGRMVNLMLILLEYYELQSSIAKEKLELIGHSVYFVDLGKMIYPLGDGPDIVSLRAESGAAMLRLNSSKNCAFFVEAASAICSNFYRKDAPKPEVFKGDFAPFLQMCILCDRLDTVYFGYAQYNATEFPHIVRSVKKMEPTIDPDLFKLLLSAEPEINNFYNSQKNGKFSKNWL